MENNQNDERLQLEEQIEDEARLKAALAAWNSRYEEAREQERRLYNARKKLQKEIDQLEGQKLSALLRRLLAPQQKTLAQKQEESIRLAAQYEAALEQEKEPEAQIRFYENKLLKIKAAKRRLTQLDQEVVDARMDSVRKTDAQFARLEEEIANLSETSRRLDALLQTARSAHATAGEILALIENAEQFGWLDLYGGNFFVGREKHKQLDRAQGLLASLFEQTKDFQGMLSGIRLPEEFSIRIGGFLRLSDYAFDGLVSDALTLSRIKKTYEPLKQFRGQLESAIYQINAQRTQTQEECARKQGRLRQKLFQ